MKISFLLGLLAAILTSMPVEAAQSGDHSNIINIMVLNDMPESPTDEQVANAETNHQQILDALNERDLSATFYSTQDFIDTHARLYLTNTGLSSNIELAMSGNHSNETLSDQTYEEQLNLLRTSKKYVEACRICGKNEIIVTGFMPQRFDQNEDTYKALDELDIQYNTGYQAEIIYAPGHEKDTWPYNIKGHSFYAVPISTYILNGEKIVLQDIAFADKGLSASEWYDALVGKFDEIQGKDEPLVIILTTSISGSGDYLDALNRFMDYAISKKAIFVKTRQLVDMAKTGVRDISALPAEDSGVCLTCGQSDENISIASIVEATQLVNNTNHTMASAAAMT